MTNRERLLAVFQNKIPDVIPFVPDLTYYYGVLVPDLGYQYTGRKAGTSTPAQDAAAHRFINFHLEHHCIPYYQYQVNAFQPEYVKGVVLEEMPEGDRQFSHLKLGGKSLVKVSEYSAISHSSAPLKYPRMETSNSCAGLENIWNTFGENGPTGD